MNRLTSRGSKHLILLAGFLFSHPSTANPAPDAVVRHTPGQARGHLEDCPRFTKLSDADKARMERITAAELEKRGAVLCSRCPGSNTPGEGNPHLLPPENRPEPLPESWVNPAPAEITRHECMPNPSAPLIFMGPDGKLAYRPFSDKGDKLMDWSYCGYKNSTVPIPMVPVVVTLNPHSNEAINTGNLAYAVGEDSRAAIQAAIDRVATLKPNADGIRGAVLLKRGTHYVSGSLRIGSGVVLRGEGDGEDGTVLIMTSETGGDTAIRLGDSGAKIETVGSVRSVRITNPYLPSGSIRLDVEDASQFRAGNYIHVRKTTNQRWIDTLGMGERLRHIRGGREGLNKRPWVPEAYRPAHLRRIKAIDGKTITLDGVLPESIDEEHGGGIVSRVAVDALGTHSGIESLRLVSNYDTTMRDTGKDSNFRNFHSGITVAGTYNSWVRNCTVLHVSFAAVRTSDNSRQITVRDIKCLAPVGPKRGGFRYAFNIGGGTLHLFYKCYSENGRHDFAVGSRATGPFAFVECTAVRGQQSEPHHRWSTGILYDSVITKDGTLAAINRGDSGSGHGWAAANTMFWNCDAKSIVVMDPETAGENNFAIGYRGTFDPKTGLDALRYTNDRAGYWGTPQEGKYYGFALMGSGHLESPDKPVEPGSLFKQQLIDRIGADKAAAVLK
jgi:hypothetical protein